MNPRRCPRTMRFVVGLAALWLFLTPVPAMASVAMQTPELARIESMAERAADIFMHGDFNAASRLLHHMRRDFYAFHRRALRKPYDERRERELATMALWVKQMGIAISHRSRVGGAIAANQLIASLIRYQDFPDMVRGMTAWFDYLSRDIVLLNMESHRRNASLLQFRLNDLQMTWHTLRRLLLRDMRNKVVTLQVDGVIGHMVAHTDKTSQIQDGLTLLKLDDKLNRLPDPLQAGAGG